jgi:hypothetical protein
MSLSLRAFGRLAAIGAATIAIGAVSANADNGFTMELSVDGGAPILFDPTGDPVGDGVFNFAGQDLAPNYFFSWDINAKADPFVSGNVVFVNNSLSTLTFSLTIIQLVNPAVLPSSLMGGSVAGGLTTDLDGGSLASVGDTPVWNALIDGNVVASLLTNPFSVGNPGAGSAAIGPESFGTPIPSLPGPAALTSIAINLTFSLTPGDQASFTSIFVVNAIPGPAGLALLGLAGVMTGSRRRRS